MVFSHEPVLSAEVLTGLAVKPEGIYVDGTVGGAGHAVLIAQLLKTGFLIGIDRDADAVAHAQKQLANITCRCAVLRDNFKNMPQVLERLGVASVDGILLDLGVSSHQLDTVERGFSYREDAKLDMRMDDRDSLTAYEIVNHYQADRLTDILFTYGEERFARRIVQAIIKARQTSPIETTLQLSALIKSVVPPKMLVVGAHPAKKTFQALRIEVNGELAILERSLNDMALLLNPGGRLCVIDFHSLEDRIVKHTFKRMENPCQCPRELPVCVCGKKPIVRVVTRKPIAPGEAELERNHRAHSAKLRVAERV